jgi:hypothetical protein
MCHSFFYNFRSFFGNDLPVFLTKKVISAILEVFFGTDLLLFLNKQNSKKKIVGCRNLFVSHQKMSFCYTIFRFTTYDHLKYKNIPLWNLWQILNTLWKFRKCTKYYFLWYYQSIYIITKRQKSPSAIFSV